MATTTYNYGWESLAEWGVGVPTNDSSFGTSVTPDETFAYLKSATITANSNTIPYWVVGSAQYRKVSKFIKGQFATTANLTFNMANDMDASCLDAWILKMGLDAFNVAHDGSKWVVPNTGTSVYGSNVLLGFTLEIGHNSAAPRVQKLAGCAVDKTTVRARAGEPIEFTMDVISKTATFDNATYTAGSVTASTKPPLTWGDCTAYYADDGTQTARTVMREWEATIANNLVPVYDLSSSATMEFNRMICGNQELTGSFMVDMSTTAGTAFYDALCDDASAPFINTTVVDEKETELLMGAASSSWDLRFRKICLPEVPLDIDPSKVQGVTIGWTGQYYLAELNTTDTVAITNWDDQS